MTDSVDKLYILKLLYRSQFHGFWSYYFSLIHCYYIFVLLSNAFQLTLDLDTKTTPGYYELDVTGSKKTNGRQRLLGITNVQVLCCPFV